MAIKRLIDIILAIIGLVLFSPILIIISMLIVIFSGLPIFFIQKRVGRYGRLFNLIKFRTMVKGECKNSNQSTITVINDKRITSIGHILRKWKLDELPTLINVLLGDMSLVGPRPDVPGYADCLKGNERKILDLRPGITGPATLKYADEEKLLAEIDDPVKYNDEVIFPDKVSINLKYMDNWSLWTDIIIIFKSVFRKNY